MVERARLADLYFRHSLWAWDAEDGQPQEEAQAAPSAQLRPSTLWRCQGQPTARERAPAGGHGCA